MKFHPHPILEKQHPVHQEADRTNLLVDGQLVDEAGEVLQRPLNRVHVIDRAIPVTYLHRELMKPGFQGLLRRLQPAHLLRDFLASPVGPGKTDHVPYLLADRVEPPVQLPLLLLQGPDLGAR